MNKQMTEHEIKANAHLLLKINIEKVTGLIGSAPSSSSFYKETFRELGVMNRVRIPLRAKISPKAKKVQKYPVKV
jgi:hypothetical protein